MPSVTVTSLKTENDSLKGKIATLRRGFEYLQKSLTRNDAQESGNGGEPSCSTRKTKYWILFSSVEKLTMTSPCKLIRVFNRLWAVSKAPCNLSSVWSRKCYRWNSALQLPIQCQDSRSPRNRLARIGIRHYVFMHKPSKSYKSRYK